MPLRSYRSLLFKFWIVYVFQPPFGGLGTTYDDHLGLVFLAAAGYPDYPNFGPPPKIRRKNAAAENAAEF